ARFDRVERDRLELSVRPDPGTIGRVEILPAATRGNRTVQVFAVRHVPPEGRPIEVVRLERLGDVATGGSDNGLQGLPLPMHLL
ncbi:hypothetical protein LCGC14_2455760, partial [marine sediment metagenome]